MREHESNRRRRTDVLILTLLQGVFREVVPMPAPFRLLLSLAAVGLLAGCRSGPEPRGTAFEVTSLYNPNPARAVDLYVDGAHLVGRPPNARAGFDLELQQDGCARGDVGGNKVEVCPVPTERGGSDSVKTFRLDGPLGSRTFTLELRGDRLFIDFGANLGRAQFNVPEGFLREHPEMIAAAWFYGQFGLPRPGSETQAYVIEPRRS